MRLKWEHALSRTLAGERGDEGCFDQVPLASLAVSCLSTALWRWQDAGDSASIGAETLRAFERAAAAITGG